MTNQTLIYLVVMGSIGWEFGIGYYTDYFSHLYL